MTGGAHSTILVVDDEPAIRLLCRINLELEGYAVLEAGTVGQARERLDAELVDLVLLDLHLGGEPSHGLVRECAARTPRVPVVLVTGSANLDAAGDLGADAVLPKPFELDELAATVRRLAGAPAR